MGSVKAVLFDMDGVLIEAKDWHYEALNKALGLFGLAISRHDHLVTYDGLPTREKLRILSQEGDLPAGLHGAISNLKQRFTREMIFLYCRPVFHHQYALARLKREGYRLAVCSNAIRATVDLMLEAAHLGESLEFSLSNEDVAAPKPDPEIYEIAIKRLDLSPDECLILEDNEYGIEAARRSGAHVLEIETVRDMTYDNIAAAISTVDGGVS